MDIFNISASVSLDSSGFESGVNGVQHSAGGAADAIGSIGDATSSAESGLGGVGDAGDAAASGLDDAGEAGDSASSGIDGAGDAASSAEGSFDGLGDAASDTAGEMDELGSASDGSGGKLDALGVAVGNFVGGALTELVSKIGEAAEEVIDLGTTTETAYAKLTTIAGQENIDSLTDSISELSIECGVSSSELANTAYNAISAGASVDEAMDYVEAATKLAKAGFTDTDSALSVLTTTMNSYGDEAGTVEEISDSLIQVQNLGVTTVSDLAGVMGKAIATGSAYGVNLGNLESAYVSLTKSGIDTHSATTYLNSMINELGSSSSTVSEVIKDKTGKSFDQLMDEGYSLADVMEILYDSCDGDSAALMNLWGSANAGKAASAIVNQGLDEFNDNLVTITSSAGATEEAYSIMADTMETKMDIMSTGFEEFGLSVYDSISGYLGDGVDFVNDDFLPALMGVVDGSEDITTAVDTIISGAGEMLTQFLQSIIEALPEIIETFIEGLVQAVPSIIEAALEMLTGIVEAIPIFIEDLVTRLPDIIDTVFNSLIEAIPEITEAAIELFNGIIEAIPTIVESLVENMPEIINSIINGLVEAIPALIQAAIEFLMNIPKQIPEIAKEMLKLAPQIIEGLISGITNALSGLWECVKNIGNTIWGGIKSFFGISSPSKLMAEVGEDITAGLTEGMDDMPDEATDIAEETADAVSDTMDGMTVDTGDSGEEITQEMVDNMARMRDEIKDITAEITSIYSSWGDSFVQTGRSIAVNMTESMTKTMENLPDQLLSVLTKVTQSVTSWGNSIVKSFQQIGVAMMQGLMNGTSSMVNSLYNQIYSQMSGLVTQAKASLGISSPSKVFEDEVGEMIGEGLVLGIQNTTDNVEGAMDSLLDATDIGSYDIGSATAEISGTSAMSAEVMAFNENFDRLFSMLESYFPEFAAQKEIRLDSGELVGATVDKIDTALYKRGKQKARQMA